MKDTFNLRFTSAFKGMRFKERVFLILLRDFLLLVFLNHCLYGCACQVSSNFVSVCHLFLH